MKKFLATAVLLVIALGSVTAYAERKNPLEGQPAVRKRVEFLDEDRPLYPDHTVMQELIRSCEVLHEVERAIGPLG